MTEKILVTYATKLGATAEVAEAIGETISKKDAHVDVSPIKDATNISAYDRVVLGSAIRMGQWLPEAVQFAKRHQDHLNQIPVSIFTVHILNLGDDAESERERQAYTKPIREILTPSAEAFFAGKIDPAQLNFFERLLFKAVKSPSGDLRDWTAIQSWANQF